MRFFDKLVVDYFFWATLYISMHSFSISSLICSWCVLSSC